MESRKFGIKHGKTKINLLTQLISLNSKFVKDISVDESRNILYAFLKCVPGPFSLKKEPNRQIEVYDLENEDLKYILQFTEADLKQKMIKYYENHY